MVLSPQLLFVSPPPVLLQVSHRDAPPPNLCTQVLDEGLERGGVPYSYGFAIIVLTILVKAATFPLTKKQARAAAVGHQQRLAALHCLVAANAGKQLSRCSCAHCRAGVAGVALSRTTSAALFVCKRGRRWQWRWH